MTLADLRPEQRTFAERVLYSVGRDPRDPVYAGLIAEAVAMHDQVKDDLLRMCEDRKHDQVLLFRGPELYQRLLRNAVESIQGVLGDNEIWIRHRERVQMVPLKEGEYNPADLVENSWMERFALYGRACKHCGALHYYSQNWLEMPDWVKRDDFDNRYGYRAREHQLYIDHLMGSR